MVPRPRETLINSRRLAAKPNEMGRKRGMPEVAFLEVPKFE